MAKESLIIRQPGYVLIDVLLGAALFVILIGFMVPAFLYGEESAQLSGRRQRAVSYAREGLEAVRNIRDNGFNYLIDGNHGLATSSGYWALSGTGDAEGEFTRRINITHETPDKVIAIATVDWLSGLPGAGSITLESRFDNFMKPKESASSTATYTINIDSDWNIGYCATVDVSTESVDPIIWNIDVDLSTAPYNGEPTSVWNAIWSFTDPILNASGEAFNESVSAGNPVSFGYCADRSSEPPATGTSTYAIVINSDWGIGYCATVEVSTESVTPIAWNVDVDLSTAPYNGIPNTVWNAIWSFNAPILNASGEAFNQLVSAGNPVSFGYCADRPAVPDPGITIVASASNPADNGSAAGPTVAITPPGGLEVGDVIVMSTMYRGTATINIGNTGGQSWTVLSQQADGSISAKLFYSVFNGTWTANPSVTVGTGSLGLTAVMHAFRNVDPTVIDVAPVAANFASPLAPRDVTISGISTASNGTLVMAVWATPDDNTWGLQTAGWANIGSAQYRNRAGNDSSLSTAYLLLPATGPSGDVVNRQVLRGGDAGVSFIMSLKQQP